MSLIGNTNEEKIWNYFISTDKIGNPYGVAGFMGNIKKESNFNPKNMQNSFEGQLKFTDETYVIAVDNNTYSGFQTDRCGFGLCQWTKENRKTNMWIRSKETRKSIGDLEFQLDFIWWEFTNGYGHVLEFLRNTKSIKDASDYVCKKYERPANQSSDGLKRRSDAGENIYIKFVTQKEENEKEVINMGYTNSPLVNYIKISPHKTSPRNHTIDTITIHCYVGQVSVERIGKGFSKASRGASCNYGIGSDGRIALIVDEKDRSWCSDSRANDHRAITIEVACDSKSPYKVNNVVMESLIKLVADICERNDIKKLVWSTNKKERVNHLNVCNMTVHRDFANKSCPGAFLYDRHGYIANEVNKMLGIQTNNENTTSTTSTYTQIQFIKDIQSAIGVTTDGIVGIKTLSALPTVSKSKNNKHAVVKPLQKYLNTLGFDCGVADGVAGTKFDTASRAWAKVNSCVADGEFTANGKSWKTILGYNSGNISVNNSTSTISSNSLKYISNGVDYSPVFDPTYYANKYSDLKKAFGSNSASLWNHFKTYGLKEGRQGSANFNVIAYKNRYTDLQRAFGSNLPEYYKHYCQFGYKEGRSAL